MSDLPPIFLLIDLSALLAGKTREWQEILRLGSCFVPQVIYEEMKVLSKGAIEKQYEGIAREFIGFLPDSGWQLSGAGAMHPALVPSPGQRESKRARLALAVAECAYGLARNSPGRLVVLVSNDQALIQRLHGVGAANLCGLPFSVILNWSRSSRRPPVITHQMQAMKAGSTSQGVTMPSPAASLGGVATTTVAPYRAVPSTVQPPHKGAPPRSKSTPPRRITKGERISSSFSNYPSAVSQLMGILSAVVAAMLALGIVWYVVQPRSLNQFLHHLNLPTLPENLTNE
jgi:hypothetical protein